MFVCTTTEDNYMIQVTKLNRNSLVPVLSYGSSTTALQHDAVCYSFSTTNNFLLRAISPLSAPIFGKIMKQRPLQLIRDGVLLF